MTSWTVNNFPYTDIDTGIIANSDCSIWGVAFVDEDGVPHSLAHSFGRRRDAEIAMSLAIEICGESPGIEQIRPMMKAKGIASRKSFIKAVCERLPW